MDTLDSIDTLQDKPSLLSKIDVFFNTCKFFDIEQFFICYRKNRTTKVVVYYSLILIDNKYYLKKYTKFDKDYYEIAYEPLFYSDSELYDKTYDDKLVTIKDDVYLTYKIYDNELDDKISACKKLLYKKNDIISFRKWNDTLMEANNIDISFFRKYNNIISFR